MSFLCKPRINLLYRCEPSAKSQVQIHTPPQRAISLLRPSSSPGLSRPISQQGLMGSLGHAAIFVQTHVVRARLARMVEMF